MAEDVDETTDVTTSMVSPWDVKSVMELCFFCCPEPECDYKNKTLKVFEEHATKNHQDSVRLFNQTDDIKTETDIFQASDALELQWNSDAMDLFKDDPEFVLEDDDILDDEEVIEKKDIKREIKEEPMDLDLDDIDDKDPEFVPAGHKKLFKKKRGKKRLPPAERARRKAESNKRSAEKQKELARIKREEKLRVKDGDEAHSCTKCSRLFPSLVELGRHFNRTHSSHPKGFDCLVCFESFSRPAKLMEHNEVKHGTKRYVCENCGKTYTSVTGLKTHMIDTHGGGQDKSEKNYKCDQCKYKTHLEKYLIQHKFKKHNKDKHPHVCDVCAERFPFKCLLTHHRERFHLGIKKFICEECGKDFNSKANLRYHNENGNGCKTNKKPEVINCPDCGDVFTKENYMLLHYRHRHGGGLPPGSTYENRQPIECDECDAVFYGKNSLRLHKLAKHPLVNPKGTQCDFCDQVFINPKNLKAHIKEIHEKPLACPKCNATFAKKCKLRTHIKNMHHPDLRCNVCRKVLSSPELLEQHKAAMHRTENIVLEVIAT